LKWEPTGGGRSAAGKSGRLKPTGASLYT
jgi:hypothetical protein